MEYIIIIVLVIITLVILKIIMTTKFSKLKEFMKNDKLDKLAEKLPQNMVICEQILEMLDNGNVTIEESDIDTSMYTIFDNKITISRKQAQYTRLQTIAHECLHSVQTKKMLWFNFIFTNIYLIYFVIISILTIVGVIEARLLQIAILLLFGLIHHSVRSYLETDAMTKAKYISEKYIDKYNVYNEVEKHELLLEYTELNNIGIPYTSYNILFSNLMKVLIYTIICLIITVI